MMSLSLKPSSVGQLSCAPTARPQRAGRTSVQVQAFWKKKKTEDEPKKPKKAETLRDRAAANKAEGWVSASKGAAGFANKKKSYIEVIETEAYVDEDADFMGKLMGMFGGKKKE